MEQSVKCFKSEWKKCVTSQVENALNFFDDIIVMGSTIGQRDAAIQQKCEGQCDVKSEENAK